MLHFKNNIYIIRSNESCEKKKLDQICRTLFYFFVVVFRFFSLYLYKKIMYLSSSDGVNDGDADDSSQNRQGSTPPVSSAVCKFD